MIWVILVELIRSEEWPTQSEQWPNPPPKVGWPSISPEWPKAPYTKPDWPTNTEAWPNNPYPTETPGDNKKRNLVLIIVLSSIGGILVILFVTLFIFRKNIRCLRSKVKKSAATETLLQNKDPEL